MKAPRHKQIAKANNQAEKRNKLKKFYPHGSVQETSKAVGKLLETLKGVIK